MLPPSLKGKSGELYFKTLGSELQKLYAQANDFLSKEVLKADISEFAKFRFNDLLAQVKTIQTALDAAAKEFSEAGIPEGYQRGMEYAAEQMATLGITSHASMGNKIHQAGVQALADQMTVDLLNANQSIAGTFQSYLRKTQQKLVSDRLINRRLAQGLIAGQTRKQTSDRILQALKEQIAEGKTLVINGKQFDPGYYAALVTRTRTREAVTTGSVNASVEAGMDLFQVSVHDNACPICTKYQGRVYSISGEDHAFPILQARPPFHPNCRHVLAAVTKNHLQRLGQYDALVDLSNDEKEDVGDYQKFKDFMLSHKPDATTTAPKDFAALGGPAVSPPVKEPAPSIPRKAPEVETEVPIPTPATVSGIPTGIEGADAFGARLKPVEGGPKLGGSTGAKLFVDDEGTKWVVKTYGGNELQAKNEFIANKIYELNKIAVPEARLATVNGKTAIAAKFIDEPGAVVVGQKYKDAVRDVAAFKRGFATDAFLANWDSVGLDYDNLMTVPGKKAKVWRIDQGGSLLFRAQGTPKGQLFGNAVNELTSLRNPSINPQAAHMFSSITDDELKGYVNTLTYNAQPKLIKQIIASSGLEAKEAAELEELLLARRKYLLNWLKTAKAKQSDAIDVAKAVTGTKPGDRRTHAHQTVPQTFSDVEASAKNAALSVQELKKLKQFTGSYYRQMNEKAWKQKVGEKELDELLWGDKLPGWSGWSVRGTSQEGKREEKWNKWLSGEWAQVDWAAYSSTSIDPTGKFSDFGGFVYAVFNRGLQGSYVSPLSSHPHERELLFGRNSKFRVVGWDKQGQRYIVFLEETAEDIPLSQEAPPQIDSAKFLDAWKQRYKNNKSSADLKLEDFR